MNMTMIQNSVYFLQAGHAAGDSPAAVENHSEHHAETAADGGHNAHHEAPKDFKTLLNETNTVAFLLVVVFFIWVFNQFKLTQKIADSRQGVEDEIKAIESEKEKALAELEAIKERTANLENEVKTIIDDAETTANNLSNKILEDANVQVGKIVDTAKKRIELEQKSVSASLEKRLLNDALADAREELVQSMSTTEQKRSIETFLDEMPVK